MGTGVDVKRVELQGGITDVLTSDKHFQQAGFRAMLLEYIVSMGDA